MYIHVDSLGSRFSQEILPFDSYSSMALEPLKLPSYS